MAKFSREIHSILSSYPIFSNSMILAPKTVMNSISLEIRKFLWQGGKVQNKKYHLVNWNMVKASKIKGGLGMRDPEQMNKSLGSKLIWRMAIGEMTGRKKYIKKPRSKIPDSNWEGKGTSIWKLYKNSINLFKNELYWIPGNGKRIKI